MYELFSRTEFWFGATALCAYQVARFNELGSQDPEVTARSANLRAIDFAGKLTYSATLAAFLAATLVIYFVLCSISPTILMGWANATGGSATANAIGNIAATSYPLYIAAAFIGFTQPGIPFLSNIGNVQRNIFHAWMGVPTRVMGTSSFFSNQIFNRSPGKQLGREVQALISDAWVERIGAYADTEFYRAQLARLKLEDEPETARATRRELKILTRQLVDAAALATVRESGVASLAQLADDLRVSMTSTPHWPKAFIAGFILFLIGMTILLNLIPLFDGLAAQFLNADRKWDFWPNSPQFSTQYIVSQATPMYLATAVVLWTWLRAAGRARAEKAGRVRTERADQPGTLGLFDRYLGLFVLALLGIVLFDLLQGFFDYGTFEPGKAGSFLAFIRSNMPFYLLHSFISFIVCFALLYYLDAGSERRKWKTAIAISILTAGVASAAFFYAVAQVHYKFNVPSGVPFGVNGADLAVLMVILNVSAGLLAFASAALCRRQFDLCPDELQQLAEQGPPSIAVKPVVEIVAAAAPEAVVPLATKPKIVHSA